VAAAATAAVAAATSGSSDASSEVTDESDAGGEKLVGTGVGENVHLLTDEEIEAGASDVPLGATDDRSVDQNLGSNR
jgi:hypothetical protein